MYNSIENLSTEDLNQLLEHFRKSKEKYKRELNRMPPGALARVRENGHTRYIHLIYEKVVEKSGKTPGGEAGKTPGTDGGIKFIQRRKGITNDKAMINKLARKKFVFEAQRS
nr:hypothetical protein [Bacillota bacterium]